MQTFYKKLKLLAVALMMLVSSAVWAAFVKNMPQTLTQPNGQVIHVFATGDEYYNWLHDAEEFTIVLNKTTGYYVYATKVNGRVAPTSYVVGQVDPKTVGLTPKTLDDASYIKSKVDEMRAAQSSAKRRAKTAAGTPSVRPGTGIYNNIVVYIEFADQNGGILTRTDAEGRFNNVGAISVKDYYNEVSNGQLNVTSYFYPTSTGTYPVYYKDSHPRSYYCKNTPDGYGDGDYSGREHTLLKNAIDAISSQVPSTLNIDGNNDGFVDNVTFVINGSTDGWGNLLWPHRWSLFSQTAFIGTKQVYDYNNVFTADLGVGVICHEMFHSFGGPDLYEYGSGWSGITPVGSWDVMASNDWFWPQHMSVYMKARYGTWTTIPEITTTGNYSLLPVSGTNPFPAYKIKLPNSTKNEYIVLEYKKKDGRYESAQPYADGLLIYRINETGNNPSGPEFEMFVYRKDGSNTVQGDLGNAAFHQSRGTTAFNDNTNPAAILSNGQAAGFTGNTGISNINVTATGVTFTFTAATTGGSCTDPAWVSTNTYLQGNKVSYNGRKYTANYWNQNARPDQNCCAAGEEWTDDGVCASNAAPTTSIASPANNSTFLEGTNLTIDANAFDSDGTISKVEFYAGSTKLGEDLTAPFSYIYNAIPFGNYVFTVKATDNGGLSTVSSIVNVTVKRGPTLVIVSPTEGQTVNVVTGGVATIDIDVNDEQIAIDSVKYIITDAYATSGNVRRFTTFSAPFDLTFTPALDAARTDIMVIAFGNGANVSQSVSAYYRPTTTTPPAVSITSPATGTVITEGVDLTLTANATDSDGTIAKVEFYVGSTKMGEDLTAPYSFTWTNIAYGNFHFTAKAIDNLGAIAISSPVNVIVNALPVVTVTAPVPVNGINPKYVVGGNVTISANVTDIDGTITKVEFTHGNNLGLVTVTNAPYTATLTNLPSPAPDGSYWFTVKAFDNRGGTTSSIIYVYRNRIPTITITSPANNSTATAGSNVTITTVVYDPDFVSGKVEFFNGATKLGEVTSAPYNYTISNIAAGSYAITAKVTDDMNESATSTAVNFTVPAGGCSALQYVENGGYVAGSRVKNNGTQYECKGYPFTSWCNGAAWAYAPGTGSYWADAWTQIGTCRAGEFTAMDANALTMYPNPASEQVTMTYITEGTGTIKLYVVNEFSVNVLTKTVNLNAGENLLNLDLNQLNAGIYTLKIEDAGKVITKKLSVVK